MILSYRAALLAGFGILAFAAPAQAQQNEQAVQNAPQAQRQGELPDQSTIIVTGTRRTDRTVANSPVPVDVLSAETLSHSGFTEVNRALTQEVPSFNFPQPWAEVRHEDVWVHPRQVEDLRVLAPLVDGKVKPLFPRIS